MWMGILMGWVGILIVMWMGILTDMNVDGILI